MISKRTKNFGAQNKKKFAPKEENTNDEKEINKK